MTLLELQNAFNFDGVNRSNAVVNFSDADPIDPLLSKARTPSPDGI